MKLFKNLSIVLISNLIFAQTEIKIDDNAFIQYLYNSENYIGYTEYNETTFKTSAVLFDVKRNKEIFRMYDKDYFQVIPVEASGIFLVITAGIADVPGKEDTPERIDAYRIESQTLKWTTTLSASLFEVSPSGKYLITNCVDWLGIKGKFEILNLENGERINTNLNIDNFHATWYDEDKIIIAKYPEKKTVSKKVEKKNIFKEDESNYRNAILKEFELRDSLRSKIITQEEYDKRIVNYKANTEKVLAIMKNNKSKWLNDRNKGPLVDENSRSTIDLLMYSISEAKIISQNSIYSDNKSKISMQFGGGSTTKIFIDNEGNILLYGYKLINNIVKNFLFKVSRNLEYLSEIDISGMGDIKKIQVKNKAEIIYIDINSSKRKILDTKIILDSNGLNKNNTDAEQELTEQANSQDIIYFKSENVYYDNSKKVIRIINNEVQ